MDPASATIVSALINGGFDLFGSAMSSFFGDASAKRADKRAYKYSRRLQLFQQQWAERMSNTAHQREVADLRAAGLNPILTATGGQGAATPSVSSPSITGHDPDPQISADVGDIGGTYASLKNAESSAKNAESSAKNADTQSAAQKSQASLNSAHEVKAYADAMHSIAEAEKAGAIGKTLNEGRKDWNTIKNTIPGIIESLTDGDTWKGMFSGNSAKSNPAKKPYNFVDDRTFKTSRGRDMPAKNNTKPVVPLTNGWKR